MKTPHLPSIQAVVDDIAKILDETGIDPNEFTVVQYSKNGGLYDGRMLRRLGGFTLIKDSWLRERKKVDIKSKHAMTEQRGYVTKLEKQVAGSQNMLEKLEDVYKRAFKELIASGGLKVSNINKPKLPVNVTIERENGVMLSDIHMGLKIDREEVGCNAYDWLIAARRLGKLAEQVALFKRDHRAECARLRVLLGGDLGQGVIHLDDDGTELMTYQFTGMAYYLVQMIDYWRHFYHEIVVECTPDNHLRLPHKGPNRQFSQKHDSFATMLSVAIQMAFRHCDDVKFHVPKSPITTFDMLGHKMALTHGDTHVSSGNVGKEIKVKSVADQVLRMNSAAVDGRKYAAIFVGHVHVPAYVHMPECGADLIVNGTASGTDGYAHGIGIHGSAASQVMWETTKDYAVGDFRRVRLDDADDEVCYDNIIAEYLHGYEINKMLFPHKRA